jgi:hypothetical protein
MAIKNLETGVIYRAGELLPIHRANSEYSSEGNASIIPDGVKWVKAITHDGLCAFNKENFSVELVEATQNDGTKIYIHQYYSDYIRGRDAQGNQRYFTTEEAAKANDFDFSYRLGRWHDKKCDSFYGDETLMEYHDRRLRNSIDTRGERDIPKFIQDGDEVLIGVEVEKVDAALQRDILSFKLYQETGWRKEIDGSLINQGGYELVSPVLPLFDSARIERACSPVRKYINAQSDASCGGHFNISKKGVDSRTFLKGMKGFVPILYALYENRLNNRFCRARNWNHYFQNIDKYSAFYLKSSNIVEIRLFPRITNYNVMMWRIKLMQLLMQDYGRNLNQFVLKMSATESALYRLLRSQYTHQRIAEKLRMVDKYSEMYNCGTISNSVRDKVNKRFGYIVLPLK